MNFDECLNATIQDSLTHTLERMKMLNEDDRQALLFEFIEFIAGYESEEILLVPNFE